MVIYIDDRYEEVKLFDKPLDKHGHKDYDDVVSVSALQGQGQESFNDPDMDARQGGLPF